MWHQANQAYPACSWIHVQYIIYLPIQYPAYFISLGTFSFYMLRIYKKYESKLDCLYCWYNYLERAFNNRIFLAATFNCGCQVITLNYVDHSNVLFSFCAIFSCDSYNSVHDGHVILFGLVLVIQFSPDSTILISSGTLHHSNVSIHLNETCQSYT